MNHLLPLLDTTLWHNYMGCIAHYLFDLNKILHHTDPMSIQIHFRAYRIIQNHWVFWIQLFDTYHHCYYYTKHIHQDFQIFHQNDMDQLSLPCMHIPILLPLGDDNSCQSLRITIHKILMLKAASLRLQGNHLCPYQSSFRHMV